MSVVIEADRIVKEYSIGKEETVPVLNKISLQIKKGEFISVMGASGSGKSTLLYNISGMDRLTSGEVLFLGKDICTLSERELSELRLKKMGFVFQQGNLLKNLNIFDNIVLSAYLAKQEKRSTIDQRAKQLMEKTGILQVKDRYINQVSGGQLQRAAVCRALINKPQILFGDEPTGALNSKSANEIMDIFMDINNSGTTIMLVTHDVKVAAKTEKVLFMQDGSIVGKVELGKFQRDKDDLSEREYRLSMWLLKMGF